MGGITLNLEEAIKKLDEKLYNKKIDLEKLDIYKIVQKAKEKGIFA